MAVRAYVYRGEWVADCSRDGCANTEFLFARRYPAQPWGPDNPRETRLPSFVCTNCFQQASIAWPDEGFMQAVVEVLSKRPLPDTRNWYPQDHPVALAFRLEHGQSLAELREENEAHGVPA